MVEIGGVMTDMHSLPSFFIMGETVDGALSAGTRDLGKQVPKMASLFGARPMGILTGHESGGLAKNWADLGRMPVILLEDSGFRFPNPNLAVSAIFPLILEKRPVFIAFSHSLRACQTASTLAFRLKFPLVTAVESVQKEKDGWLFTRAVLDGRLKQKIRVEKGPVIATFMPGIFSGETEKNANFPETFVEIRHLAEKNHRFVPLSIQKPEISDQRLEKAQVVVAGGRGLGSEERLPLLYDVADIFKNSAVGGSRVACDMGWFSYALQIGETGRSVSPALYLACGISGSPQHLAGIQDARTVVAVNTDSRAPMLNRAHYAVIEDLAAFLPVLKERYEDLYSKGEKE